VRIKVLTITIHDSIGSETQKHGPPRGPRPGCCREGVARSALTRTARGNSTMRTRRKRRRRRRR